MGNKIQKQRRCVTCTLVIDNNTKKDKCSRCLFNTEVREPLVSKIKSNKITPINAKNIPVIICDTKSLIKKSDQSPHANNQVSIHHHI